MKSYQKFFLYQNKFIQPYIDLALNILDGVAYLASLLFVISVVISFGYDITTVQEVLISKIYRTVWWIFLIDILAHLLLNYNDTKREYK